MPTQQTHDYFLNKLKKLNISAIPLEEYKNARTKIRFQCQCGKVFERTPDDIYRSLGLCEQCTGIIRSDSKTISQEEYLKRLHLKRPTLVIEGIYNGITKPIQLKCTQCNNVWELTRAHDALINIDHVGESGCPFCDGHLPSNTNNFYIHNTELCKNVVEPVDELKCTPTYSHKTLHIKFPDCGEVFERKIVNLSLYGFTCPICSDKISLPNKIIRNVILACASQVQEYAFEWSNEQLGLQRVDCYIKVNNQEYAIEMQGLQHYEQTSLFGPYERIRLLDDNKRLKLKESSIEEIEIDCKKSTFNYIKNNILDSKLSTILNLKDISWDDVYKQSYNSLIRDACNLYNDNYSVSQIANQLYVSTQTVRNYLKRGTEQKIINYQPH